MPGRAQHPSDEMRHHAHIIALKESIDRLGKEINDRQQHRAQAKRELRRLESYDKRRTA